MPRCFLPALALPRAGSAVFTLAVFTLATFALSLGAAPAIAQNAASAPASGASAPPPPPPPQVDPNLVVPLQLARVLPPTSLRGEVLFSLPPDVVLNGKTNARLAPGARVRAENNLLVMWNVLAGKKLKVNYTIDSYGLLMDVWILRPDELAQLWPTSAEQAAKWTYDPIRKTWSK